MSSPNEEKLTLTEAFKDNVLYRRSSIFYILIFFVPVGYILHFLSPNATLVFITNFLAIIPSARLFKFASNQLSHHRSNEILEGLLDVALNNFVELVITIIALAYGQIRVVQAAVLGSILFHILLILGLCFLIGGIKILNAKKKKLEQDFSSSSTAVQADSSVLTLACISLILPASFSLFVNQNDPNANDDAIYRISYGTSIVLLITCVFYLYFKSKSHKELFNIETSKEKNKYLNLPYSLILLIVMAVIIVFSAILLVGSINGVVESNKISKTFIGVILLPIVGHIAKYINIFYIGSEDNKDNKEKTTESEEKMENEEKTTEMMECEKMMAAKTVNSIRSSIQTAIFITPLLVILGWIINKHMSLSFLPFETICLFIAVMFRNYLLNVRFLFKFFYFFTDSKTNWLEGVMLISTYLIMGLAFFFYPDPPEL
ncbi:Sodium/calcium exchanger protein [Gigaspora rosea]|uniref:Sodium/calcium exchanger protein n=1 Tax=Gigaspora rosea TaxID=44941 RepID=A0A397UTS2_9GLOM|nr:Sodium/calcium exchanger protein [Gigaspora rosea]